MPKKDLGILLGIIGTFLIATVIINQAKNSILQEPQINVISSENNINPQIQASESYIKSPFLVVSTKNSEIKWMQLYEKEKKASQVEHTAYLDKPLNASLKEVITARSYLKSWIKSSGRNLYAPLFITKIESSDNCLPGKSFVFAAIENNKTYQIRVSENLKSVAVCNSNNDVAINIANIYVFNIQNITNRNDLTIKKIF